MPRPQPIRPPSRPHPIARPLVAWLALLAWLACSAPPATAGSYTVRQCDYAAGITQHDLVWHEAGHPRFIQYPGSNCGEFGLALRNGNQGIKQTYPSGGYAGYFAYAPPGTVFTRFSGMFGNFAWCCINGTAAYAEATENTNGSGGLAYLFQGNLGNDTFGPPSGVGGPVGRSWTATSFVAKRVGYQIRCGPGFSCPQQTYGDIRLRGRSFDFTLRDDIAPALGDPSGTLGAGGWMRGTRTLGLVAGDQGGGLATLSASFDSGVVLSAAMPCAVVGGRYVRLQPCPLNGSHTWTVDTTRLPDGQRTLTLGARDVGGAAVARSQTVLVDNTAPAAPLGPYVEGGPAWRRDNGFALRWSNPAGQHAPIVRAYFRACPVAGGACVDGARDGGAIERIDSIVLPRGGEWDVRAAVEDAAGNVEAGNATPPLRLRFDPDPPQLEFRPQSPASPTAVVVDATDISGLAAGEIEIRRRGGSEWSVLPTTVDGATMTAVIDDSDRQGVYELRARAVDGAGNQAVAVGPARSLPTRVATRLRAVAEVGGRARHGSTVRVALGTPLTVSAWLTDSTGGALADRPISIELASRDRTAPLAGGRTGGGGRLAQVIRAGRSAAVRLRFAGDDRALPSSSEIAILVPAMTTARVSRAVVRAGRSVVLRGHVRGGSIPSSGKLVEIQAHFRNRWRTVSTVRSTRQGRWRFRYRFSRRGGGARYRFRARVPTEAGYPFETGTSRVRRVTVRSR